MKSFYFAYTIPFYISLLLIYLQIGNHGPTTASTELLTLRQAIEQHPSNISIGTSLRYHELIDNETYPLYIPYTLNQFNTITPEWCCKWPAIQPFNRWSFDWTGCDYMYNFALENNLKMTFHTLVWDRFIPEWLENGLYSQTELTEILEDFITAVLTRYPRDTVYLWDIVNEAILDNPTPNNTYRSNFWYNHLPNYIQLSFQFARKVNPYTKLFYNDYNISITDEWLRTKADAVYDMIVDLINKGVPIDGIGFQCHFYLTNYNEIMRSWNRVVKNLERFSALGLEIQITELEVSCGYWDENHIDGVPCDKFTYEMEKKQADIFEFILEICLYIDACTSYETWGISEDITYYVGHHQLLFDKNWKPKLAAHYILNALNPNATLIYGPDINITDYNISTNIVQD